MKKRKFVSYAFAKRNAMHIRAAPHHRRFLEGRSGKESRLLSGVTAQQLRAVIFQPASSKARRRESNATGSSQRTHDHRRCKATRGVGEQRRIAHHAMSPPASRVVKSVAAPYGHTAVLESERVLHDRPQDTWFDRRHLVVRLLCECPRRGSGEAEPPAQADGRGRQAGNPRSDRYSETGRSDGLPHAPFPCLNLYWKARSPWKWRAGNPSRSKLAREWLNRRMLR